MLPNSINPIFATHWGLYRTVPGDPDMIRPFEGDADPSEMGAIMAQARTSPARIRKPSIRRSFLERGHRATGEGRGSEPFVEVPWDEASALVAREIERVRMQSGNQAIYGGSYGWASAGRFHHAQSQIHRFLNCAGGYTSSIQNYSYAAADVMLPYIIGSRQGLISHHTPWRTIAAHTRNLVMFGGMPLKNSQVSAGGMRSHIFRGALQACRSNNVRMISISPIRDDFSGQFEAEWLAIRPNTDTALLLALAQTLIVEQLHDTLFIAKYTTGFERFRSYLAGETDGVVKTAEWAAHITGLDAERIRRLAREMARERTLIAVAWALQRAQHGEQVYFAAIALASLLGQIGLPGGGFGFGYGSVHGVGSNSIPLKWPSLPQGKNPVSSFVPVARISDMLLNPGQPLDYNGQTITLPDIRMVYWAGGNPFHHHQDLNRLVRAWKKPETIVVHEMWWNALARHADIVLPVTTPMERNDIACSGLDGLFTPSHKAVAPFADSRDDYDIFSQIAARLGVQEQFTEGRTTVDWLHHMYDDACRMLSSFQMPMPSFNDFWNGGPVDMPRLSEDADLLAHYRADPLAYPLETPSGRIELYSERIASYHYEDCPPLPTWLEPSEWLGGRVAKDHPFHLISNQPWTKLHSQYDSADHARLSKANGREQLRMNGDDALRLGLSEGDIVRVHNGRGACLASLRPSDALLAGVVQLATGAWYDPEEPGVAGSLDKHGNPNVLTQDIGTSRLSQGPSAMTCLVSIERFEGPLPPITCFDQPAFVEADAIEKDIPVSGKSERGIGR